MKDVNYQLDECPVQKILNLFQRKWNLRIIYELSKHESMRFGELKKAVLDISNTVLTSTLKALENQGLVLRQQFNEVPPHVEYSLTESAKERDLNIVNSLKEDIGDYLEKVTGKNRYICCRRGEISRSIIGSDKDHRPFIQSGL